VGLFETQCNSRKYKNTTFPVSKYNFSYALNKILHMTVDGSIMFDRDENIDLF